MKEGGGVRGGGRLVKMKHVLRLTYFISRALWPGRPSVLLQSRLMRIKSNLRHVRRSLTHKFHFYTFIELKVHLKSIQDLLFYKCVG